MKRQRPSRAFLWVLWPFLALSGLPAGSVHALVIDDFSTNQSLTGGQAGTVDDAGILGGERDADLIPGSISMTVSGGTLELDGSTGASQLALIYDGNDNDPDSGAISRDLLSLDWSAFDRFNFSLSGLDASEQLDLSLRVYTGVADVSGTVFPVSYTSSGSQTLLFSSLTWPTLPDWSDVRAIEFQWTAQSGTVVAIDNLSASAVPEPASFLLLGISSLLILRRQRRRALTLTV